MPELKPRVVVGIDCPKFGRIVLDMPDELSETASIATNTAPAVTGQEKR